MRGFALARFLVCVLERGGHVFDDGVCRRCRVREGEQPSIETLRALGPDRAPDGG